MGVTMKDGADAIAIDGLFQAARAEIRKDFRWLPLDRTADWRIVQNRDATVRSKARQGRFQFQRFVNRFLHELFDDVLAPGPQRSSTESAGKSLDAGKADSLDLGG